MASVRIMISLTGVLMLAGCVATPIGPRVMVLPGYGKPFEVFQADDQICRQWAGQQIGLAPAAAANQSVVSGAAIGTLVGAGLGAAFGAAAGNPAMGAAIGAGSGLLLGTTGGANAASVSGWDAQRRFDIAYQQCMYAKGNQLPGQAYWQPSRGYMMVPPPPAPPPPPGWAPPPPPPGGPPPSPPRSPG
jgi:YMGG-like Gly-zipper